MSNDGNRCDLSSQLSQLDGVQVFTLEDYEDPLFLLSKRSDYIVWRGLSSTGSFIVADCCLVGDIPMDDTTDQYEAIANCVSQFRAGLVDHSVYLVIQAGVDSPDNFGMFAVKGDAHVRVYGRTVEIPVPEQELALTPEVIDDIINDRTKVVSETLGDLRRSLSKQLLGYSLDLLKAATSNYEGQAAQTLRNLVSDRLDEIVVSTTTSGETHRNEYLYKAGSRLTELGRFVLGDTDQFDYYRDRIHEKVQSLLVPVFEVHTVDMVCDVPDVKSSDMRV